MRRSGFSIIELLVVIGIIGLIAGSVMVAVAPARLKARDVKRKSDLGQIGRYLAASNCYVPDAGAGDYDLAELAPELKTKYPVLQTFNLPVDPRGGSNEETKYRYVINTDGKCALYANFEYTEEPATLSGLPGPTPGGGTGVLIGSNDGVNGTKVFYQISR